MYVLCPVAFFYSYLNSRKIENFKDGRRESTKKEKHAHVSQRDSCMLPREILKFVWKRETLWRRIFSSKASLGVNLPEEEKQLFYHSSSVSPRKPVSGVSFPVKIRSEGGGVYSRPISRASKFRKSAFERWKSTITLALQATVLQKRAQFFTGNGTFKSPLFIQVASLIGQSLVDSEFSFQKNLVSR